MRLFTFLLYMSSILLFFPGGKEKLAAQQMSEADRRDLNELVNLLNTSKSNNQEKIWRLFHVGLIYNKNGDADSARYYMWKALDIPGGREFQGGRILVNIANSYLIDGDYSEALKYYLKGIEVAENSKKKDERSNIVRSMANLSECYYNMGNYGQALYYAEEALRKYEEIRDIGIGYILPQICYIIGAVHLEKGDINLAEKNMRRTFKESDALYQIQGNSGGMAIYNAYGMEGLARVHLMRKEYDEALDYAAKALAYAEEDGNIMVLAKILTTLSDIHLQLEQYEESRMYILRALDVNAGAMEIYPNLSFNLAMIEMFAGNKEEASRYFRIHSNQIKLNADENFRETMTGMEVLYETEKKENRIVTLERQRLLYLLIGVIGLLLAFILFVFFRLKMRQERQEKQLLATNIIFDWEKKERKRFASDLHDGINGMLAALKIELNTTQNFDVIRKQIDECIETIRRMARGMMPSSLERYGIKASLEDYCRLFPNAHFYFFGEDKRVGGKVELMVYYCAYELVNNSFRHSEAENINVQLIQDGDQISLTVQDDGVGFDKEATVPGAGLKSITDRVTAFNGNVDIMTSPGKGTEVNIELNVKNI